MISNHRLVVRRANAISLLFVLFALCGVPGANARAQTAAAPPPSMPAPMPSLFPKSPQWREIAEASYIFCGKVLYVKEEPNLGVVPEQVFRVFRIEATREETLKGVPEVAAPLRVTPQFSFTYRTPDYGGDGDSLARLPFVDKVVFFGGVKGRRAPLPVTDAAVEAIKAEIANQALLAERFAQLPAARPDWLHNRVADLIAKIQDDPSGASGDKPDDAGPPPSANAKPVWVTATDDLMRRVGSPAVPSIIRQMDDQRALPAGAARYVNFLGFKYENGPPARVSDLFAAILPTMVRSARGEFRMYSGASEADRRAAIAGWRVWLCYTQAAAAKIVDTTTANVGTAKAKK